MVGSDTSFKKYCVFIYLRHVFQHLMLFVLARKSHCLTSIYEVDIQQLGSQNQKLQRHRYAQIPFCDPPSSMQTWAYYMP